MKRTCRQGFTLLELIVVVSILALLASILVPALGAVFERGRKKVGLLEIQQIESALSLYEENYRDFPPSQLAELGLTKHNNINTGVEALVLCLSGAYKNASYFPYQEKNLENTDADISPIPPKKLTQSVFQSKDLWEHIDPWGNPYIYFHHRDYLSTVQQSYLLDGKKQTIGPNLKRTKTGNYIGSGRYQILSCGPDGELHTEDDLASE